MNPLNGKRLRDARELLGWAQTTLAHELGAPQPTISQIEKSASPLTDSLLAKATEATGLPRSFFEVAPTPHDIAVPMFRKNSKARASDEHRLVRLHREAARAFEAVSCVSGYHPSRIPSDLHQHDTVEAASIIRALAGIEPTAPIGNMVRVLERLGIGVITTLDTNPTTTATAHSGISTPTKLVDRPLVTTPVQYRGDAMRFALAHELAHHIWDQDRPTAATSTRSPEERRAHDFAGTLLLPKAILERRVSESLNLNGYLPIKAEYGISVSAIIMAAKNNQIISSTRARSLHIQLSSRGWRSDEPVEVPNETPLLFRQALERVTDGDTHRAQELTGLPARFLTQWTNIELHTNVINLDAWRQRRSE